MHESYGETAGIAIVWASSHSLVDLDLGMAAVQRSTCAENGHRSGNQAVARKMLPVSILDLPSMAKIFRGEDGGQHDVHLVS